MTFLLGLITSRVAGPIASILAAVLLALLTLASCDLAKVRGDLDAANGKLDKANTDLGTCRANVTVMQTAIDGQNAAIAAAKAKGDQIAAGAAKAVQQAQDALQRARKAASVISQPIGATEACARVEEIDKRFLESVR